MYMNTTDIFRLFALTALAASLSACGGGGSDASSASTAAGPALGTGTAAPTPSPTPAPSAPAPTPAPAPSAVAVVSPATLEFVTTQPGTTSATQTVTLKNAGSANLTLTSIASSGSLFLVTGGTCFPGPVVVAGASCTVTIAFQPTAHGDVTAALTFSAVALPDTVVALSGSSPSSVAVSIGGKSYTLDYPTPIGNLPDAQPASFTFVSQAAMWPLVSGLSAFGRTTAPLTTTIASSIQWPIDLKFWTNTQNGPTYGSTGCSIRLTGADLLVTVDGRTIIATIDGTPPVLNNVGQAVYAGDSVSKGVGERTIGTLSAVRSAQMSAFSGSLAGVYSNIELTAVYDTYQPQGAGVYVMVNAVSYDPARTPALLQYFCHDTPRLP